MKKLLLISIFIFSSIISFAETSVLGIIKEEELISVGVKKENVKKAMELIEKTNNLFTIKTLERRQLEIEVNKLIINDAEKNLSQIDTILDKIAEIDSTLMKKRVRSQIEMQKYITTDQYTKARDLAIKRSGKKKKKKKKKKK